MDSEEDDTWIHDDIAEIVEVQDKIDTTTTTLGGYQWLNPEDLRKFLLESCPSTWLSELTKCLDHQKEYTAEDIAQCNNRVVVQEQEFRLEESRISKEDPKHLIRSSGSLLAPVLLKLHYPSFTTTSPSDGETADFSSPIPRLLMKAGFDGGNAFWTQAYYRRCVPDKDRRSPMTKWSRELREVHDNQAHWYESNSKATVRVLFGSHNRSVSLKTEGIVAFDVKFPDELTIKVTLDLRAKNVHHLNLYAFHPEYLYRNPSKDVSLEYDTVLGLAASLAGINNFNFGYFSRRSQTLQEVGIVGRQVGDNALHDVIQCLKRERESSTVISLEEIPISIKRWLHLEMGVPENDLGNLVPATKSLVEFCHQKMVSKGGITKIERERARGLIMPSGLDSIRDANRAKDSSIQRQQQSSSGSLPAVVRVQCAKCKSEEGQFDDTNPTWDKSTGRYVSRKRSCCRTPGCCDSYTTKKGTTRKKDVDFVPVDTSILFVYARNLSVKKS